MKHKILSLLFSCLLFFNISCSNNSDSLNSSETEQDYSDDNDYNSISDGYKDGTYCAEVEYYNPSTGTRSIYDLDVEVESAELTTIYWPNKGWLDNSHFFPQDISNGDCSFTSDKGYRYTVTLGEFGGCGFIDMYKIESDINDDVEALTCPKCSNDKLKYDEYCFFCFRKIQDEEENTCSRCAGYEYGVYGGLCSYCKQNDEEGEENDEY
jgi:hypothetical protein